MFDSHGAMNRDFKFQTHPVIIDPYDAIVQNKAFGKMRTHKEKQKEQTRQYLEEQRKKGWA